MYSIRIYFCVGAGAGAGVAGTVLAGCCVAGAGAVVLVLIFCKIELSTLSDPPFKKKVENNANNAIIPANSHVPFSQTSVVCLTPIN
jgi:hypothetical protein